MDQPGFQGDKALNYRSASDLARAVRNNLVRIPDDVDLVVGIPRSGTLAGSLVALNLNVDLVDLDGYVANAPLRHGSCRQSRYPRLQLPAEAGHALLVDDSILSGNSMMGALALAKAARHQGRLSTCAIYATPMAAPLVDVYLEVVPAPRAFEWNLFHHPLLAQCCMDIDGVLCTDPSDEQNDDGRGYARFLRDAPRLALPSQPVAHLVTSRLERYRSQTEAWLAAAGVEYGVLHMLDLPDGATRRRLGIHGAFKADVYRAAKNSILFIESDRAQAIEITRLSGKPVLAFSSQELFKPGFGLPLVENRARDLARRLAASTVRRGKRLLGR